MSVTAGLGRGPGKGVDVLRFLDIDPDPNIARGGTDVLYVDRDKTFLGIAALCAD